MRTADIPFVKKLECDEIEALVLGSQWVVANGDPLLAQSALAILGKFAAVSPETSKWSIENPTVGTPLAKGRYDDSAIDVARLRSWTRHERKLVISYLDDTGVPSLRTVWPFLIGYGATSRMLIAWCELRADFRMFRTDRLTTVEFVEQPYLHDRADLRRRWLQTMKERDDDRAPAQPGS